MGNLKATGKWRRKRAILGVCIGLQTGCALGPVTPASPVDALEFLGRAEDGGPAEYAAMWKETLAAPRSQDRILRIALLQSVPGHAGYDPAEAQRKLGALIAQNPPAGMAAVARMRLDELKSREQCLAQTRELQHQLAEVVDIERQIDARSTAGNLATKQAPQDSSSPVGEPR